MKIKKAKKKLRLKWGITPRAKCEDKRNFPGRIEAEYAAELVEKIYAAERVAYDCAHCDFWHIRSK